MTVITRLPIGEQSQERQNVAINQLAELFDRSGAGPRERLTANRTYYVRSDGSDSNNGLTDTAGGAFLTIRKAMTVVGGSIDFNTFTVTVQVRPGTYDGFNIPPWVGGGTLVFTGDMVTPSNVLINTAAPAGGTAVGISGAVPGSIGFQGFKIAGTGFFGLTVAAPGFVIVQNCDFGALVGGGLAQMRARGGGARIGVATGYTISGGAGEHILTDVGGSFDQLGVVPVTLTGTPAFGTAFAQATLGGILNAQNLTFSGGATGKRYDVTKNGIIDTNGGGPNFFPGNVAGGPPATGGQYV